ncbi:hypothetical protein [Azonexus sp.]|uniref:hypothetical protein n=1 Tax=Azonexus sp. TaxID=1872668 RepID=UPI0039E4D78B
MPALPQPPASPLARIAAFLLSAGLIAAGLMFSLVFFIIAAVAGLLIGGWFWWKTRRLRRDLRAFSENLNAATSQETPSSGKIIEGEFQRDN